MMLYRRSTQLALEASLLLALEPPGSSRRVRDLAIRLNVPATYLAKIMQTLTRTGVVRAVRGPRGGVQLARPARDMRLWDVLVAIEPVGEFERCFLKLSRCNELQPCPLHHAWEPIRAEIVAMLQSNSLWDFASQAQTQGALEWKAAAGSGPAKKVYPDH